MTFNQIHCFKETAALLNITAAAARLHMTQPTLSRQISMLEEELGAVLFTRNRKGLSLTPAGQVFYEAAAMLLDYERQIREEVAKASRPPISTLRIAVLEEAIIPQAIRSAIKTAAARFPEINISLFVRTARELYEQLEMGQIDFACLMKSQIERVPSIRHVVLQTDHLCLAASNDMPIPPGEIRESTVRDFVKDTVLINLERTTFDTMYVPDVFFTADNIRYVSTVDDQVAQIVTGLGVSLVYSSHRLAETPGILLRRVIDAPTADIVLAYQSENANPGIEAFLQLLQGTGQSFG